MTCPACGAAGPTADTPELAAEGWAELVGFIDDVAAAVVAYNERLEDCPDVESPPTRDDRPPSRAVGQSPPQSRPVLAAQLPLEAPAREVASA